MKTVTNNWLNVRKIRPASIYLNNVNERQPFIRLTNITDTARQRATREQQLQILDWIKKGDARSARQVTKTNIEGSRQKVEQAFKEGLWRAFQNRRAVLERKMDYV